MCIFRFAMRAQTADFNVMLMSVTSPQSGEELQMKAFIMVLVTWPLELVQFER